MWKLARSEGEGSMYRHNNNDIELTILTVETTIKALACELALYFERTETRAIFKTRRQKHLKGKSIEMQPLRTLACRACTCS
jgi:hypothetical protein